MWSSLKKFWENHGFGFLFGTSLFIILLLAIFRIGRKGSWSSSYTYLPGYSKKSYYPQQKAKESRGEIECRRVLEGFFHVPFTNTRPNFLRNDVTGGNNLELDCYNPKLRLAIEYSGAQHYKYTPFFHKNKESFLNQKYRDDMKRRMCRDAGINLIVVPYTVKIKDINNYLLKELMSLGYL